jgi:HEPN domain-containing protein
MEKQEKIQYWLDISDYDLETARAMLFSERYLYVVFMCQQAMEKIIKALYVDRYDKEPPRSHNLAFIFKKIKISMPDDTFKFFNILSAHYIENRYPEYKKKLSTTLNKLKAEEYLSKTEESYKWIKSLLK